MPGKPAEAEVFVYNGILTVKNAADINTVRIAPGDHTTASEIKNAAGCVTLSSKLITSNSDENGDFNYALSGADVFSVWYKYNDGTQKLVSGIFSGKFVSVDGASVTVNALKGVKDFYMAKGVYTTYRQVKDAPGCIGITNERFGDAASYTRTVPTGEAGIYTLYMRHTDPSVADNIVYFTVAAKHPTVETYGRNITVGNIDDVNTIRVARERIRLSGTSRMRTAAGDFRQKP